MPSQSQIEAAQELLKRRQAQKHLIDFITYTKPNYQVARHHREIAQAFEDIDAGKLDRLMVFAPPRHGKSEIVSRKAPAWLMGKNPERQIVIASYGEQLAAGFGRDVRNLIQSEHFTRIFPDCKLSPDSQAKGKFNTPNGGMLAAVGVGSALTGMGADVLIIDDPHRDRADADSKTIRDTVWSWFQSTAYTRLMPGAALVVTLTRWHEDDISGRLLADMDTNGENWRLLNFKAIDDDGNALWPERYDIDALNRIRATIGEREFSALYQQSPAPLEGSIFKVDAVTYFDAEPKDCIAVRAWDLASTADTGGRNPDWTVGAKLLLTPEKKVIVGDVVRFRGGPEDVERVIKQTADRDGRSVIISIPQDPGQAGKAQVLALTKMLMGYRVQSSPETGAKATRAAPFAAQFNVGNVALVRGSWNRAYLDEIAAFPNSAKDDQVDASSRAFAQLIPSPRRSRLQLLGY